MTLLGECVPCPRCEGVSRLIQAPRGGSFCWCSRCGHTWLEHREDPGTPSQRKTGDTEGK
jgi:hypothetical protein